MTVITWSEFPEIKKFKNVHNSALVADEMFLPSAYAMNSNEYRRIAWKIGILVGGIGIMVLTGIDTTYAAGTGASFEPGVGLDEKANALYKKFIDIAKWIVAGKGGWDSINKMLKEDFEGAKKSFLQYLIIFAILIGLPKALNFIEGFLSDV